MALSPADIESFIEALQRDPALRERVRNAIVADDLAAVARLLQELGTETAARGRETDRQFALLAEHGRETDRQFALLAEHGRETDRQFALLAERMDAFERRQEAFEERQRAFEQRMDAFEQRMVAVERQLEALTAEVRQLAHQVHDLTLQTQGIAGRTGNLEGEMYEVKYTLKLGSMLGRHFRRVKPVVLGDLQTVQDAEDSGRISPEEWDDVMRLDVAALGTPRHGTGEEVLIAIELSLKVDESDVTRAHQRARILQKAGLQAVAAVDGKDIVPRARMLADELGVLTLVQREPEAA